MKRTRIDATNSLQSIEVCSSCPADCVCVCASAHTINFKNKENETDAIIHNFAKAVLIDKRLVWYTCAWWKRLSCPQCLSDTERHLERQERQKVNMSTRRETCGKTLGCAPGVFLHLNTENLDGLYWPRNQNKECSTWWYLVLKRWKRQRIGREGTEKAQC